MEHLFGARIRDPNGIRLFGARIAALFGAQIRDPNGTAFRGPNRGPNRTTFRGPGLLAVDVSPGALWRPPFQSAHLCPPAILSGPEWYTTFRGPNPGPEWNSVSGPESGPYNRTTFRGPGLLAARVSLGLFGGHRFNLHICVHQPSFRGPNGIRLFGARIRDPNGTAFRGPNQGPIIEQLFEARGSWLRVFLWGLFGGHRFNLHICVHQPSFRGPNGMTFSGPSPVPEWNGSSRPERVVFSCGA